MGLIMGLLSSEYHKSISNINVHPAGGFQSVGAPTRVIYIIKQLCTWGCQTSHRNKPQGRQTEEEWTVKKSSTVS